jgi:iron complex outermembrane receptor protein
VLLGGRQDYVVTKTYVRTDDLGQYLPEPFSFTDRQDAFTGRAGLVYLFDNGVAPYASFTQSFQPQSGTDINGNAFKPTEGEQYEAGVKYQPVGSTTLLMASVYNLEQSNVVVADPVNPGNSVQIGAIRSRGFEVSGQFEATPTIAVMASYSHLDQKVTAGDIPFGPQEGNTPSGSPADQASIWADWHPDGDGAGFSASLGVRYTGKSWGDDDNSFRVPSFTLVDGALRYAFDTEGDWLSGTTWSLNASNLFDETYVSSCGGLDFCAYGFRRTITGTVRKSF